MCPAGNRLSFSIAQSKHAAKLRGNTAQEQSSWLEHPFSDQKADKALKNNSYKLDFYTDYKLNKLQK